ncbi:unnamed protein product [Didymodactylos carnosus]|uniref:Protein kinase domain-containing protein n=1 Tax=Didymodactylos carnosus TaxID=1234261 RepID=A0A814F9Y0_9BILA|nr:unnamed protein product [Didymodactylos carnosus]CAF3755391.1 unnamed protein product [Didymodactylos carnosus]
MDSEDVKKARRPLYQAFGKAIYEAEWIRQTNGPKFILLQIDSARARKEAAFYVELSRHPYIVRTYGLVQQQQNNLTEDDSVMLLQEYATEGIVDCHATQTVQGDRVRHLKCT